MSSHTITITLQSIGLQIIPFVNEDKETIYGVHPTMFNKVHADFKKAASGFAGLINDLLEEENAEKIAYPVISEEQMREALEEGNPGVYPLEELENEKPKHAAPFGEDIAKLELKVAFDIKLPERTDVSDFKFRLHMLSVTIKEVVFE